MSKLISANFAKLFKDKIFWIGIGVMLAMGSFLTVMNYMQMKKYGFHTTIDDGFAIYIIYMGILLAAFCSLYVGTEYTDGTMRNKIVIGHKRFSIYLTNLIVCTVAGILMCLAYILSVIIIGTPLLGGFSLDIHVIVSIVLCSFVLSMAYTAIFTLVAMLNQSKAIVAVINILGIFILLFAAIYLSQKLSEPEIYEGYTYINEAGEAVEEDDVPNPGYITGTKREVYSFFLDFLPTGQALQLSSMSDEGLLVKVVYSFIIIILTTGGGIYFFRKKDLK